MHLFVSYAASCQSPIFLSRVSTLSFTPQFHFMRLLLLLVAMMGNGCFCWAQHAVVSCDRMNVLFAGVDNPMSIAVENVPNKSLVVKATNGAIEKVADGKYIYKGSTLGIDEILVLKKNKSGLKKVGTIPFRVQSLPDPV